MAALEELMNHSLVDDYDKRRFASAATPVCGQGVVQEGGGWDLWKHVIGYGAGPWSPASRRPCPSPQQDGL